MNFFLKRAYTLVLFYLFLIYSPSFGQYQHDIRFQTIDNTDGLPSNSVSAIIQDDLGFVWIGTSDGLSKYEGPNNVKTYRVNNPKIPGGIENSNIHSLFLDSKKNLWIGTRLGGLTKYNQSAGTWKTFRNQKDDPKSISNNEILVVTEDKEGRIWVGTENGLNLYHPKTENFTSFKPEHNNPYSISGKAVLSIISDEEGRIWAGTWGGGVNLLLPPEDGDITKARFRNFFPSTYDGAKNVWKIYQDRNDHLWIGTRGAGLFLMNLPEDLPKNPESEDWQPQFQQFSHSNEEKIGIANDHIVDIYQDVKGNLWIGTVNGLNSVPARELFAAFKNQGPDKKINLSFQTYAHQPKDNSSLINSNINTIFEDNQGILWIGTYSGISQFNWFSNQFEVFKLVDDISITPNTQNLFVESDGIVWFGYGKEGLIKFDIRENKKTNIKLPDGLLENNHVFTLFCSDNRNLYIGTKKGIIHLDLLTNESKMFSISKEIKEKYGHLEIRSIFRDKQNRIWIGTLFGIHVINENTGIYTSYSHDSQDPNSISDNSVNQIYQDSNDDIWITTFNGLNKVVDYTPENIRFTSFKHDNQKPESSIPSNRITALTEVDGILYIGSNTGISGYDLKKNQFTNFSKTNYKKNILALEKTIDGHIWASTIEGLLFFNPHTKKFDNYTKLDGLGEFLFQTNSSAKDHKGYLYFGSREGITRFHPINLSQNEKPPSVFLTDIRKMSNRGQTISDGTFASELIIDHDEYYLSIDFVAPNYNQPEKNQYAYILEGFEEKWNNPDGKQSAVYTNLAPGKYTFKVKAANNDGFWNEKGTTLKITKLPAFWETWWFKLLVAVLLFAVLYYGIKRNTSTIKARNKVLQKFNVDLSKEIGQRKVVEKALQEREQHMESLIKLRTKELENSNDKIKSLLKEIRQRNEHLEVEISKRTDNLKMSNQELQRTNKDLEQFVYIASHDLQEPLRIVGSFISLLKRRYKDQLDAEAFQYIDFAVNGVQRMSKQIKNILVFSKVSNRDIKYEKTDLNEVIESKLMDFSTDTQEKNVQFKIENMPAIICAKIQIEMVFFNLIGNAIKFNKSESPVVKISNLSTEENGYWHFSVNDNGIGIENQFKEKIFEIFRRLHNKKEYEGTGIGLALCQKIIHRHQGRIWVESVKGEGTTIHFTISKHLSNKSDNSIPQKDLEKIVK